MTSTRPVVLFVGKVGGLCNVKYAFLQSQAQDYGFDSCLVPSSGDDHQLLRASGLPVAYPCTPELLNSAAAFVVDDFPHKSALGELVSADPSTGEPAPDSSFFAGRPVIQLWHGIPLKKIGFPEIASAVNMNSEKALYLQRQYAGYACVPSTSPWMTEELFSRVFRAAEFPNLGFARNDILLRPPTHHDMLGVDQELYLDLVRHRKGGGKVVVYMPTFRDTGGNFLEDGVLDPFALEAFCLRHKIIFLTKFHPNIDVPAFRKLRAFMVCDSACDIYPLLPLADTLLTDYSSVYFDYMLLDRPLLFFDYDKDKYLTKDREMFFDYESMTPGLHCHTQEELLAALLRTLHCGEDPHASTRRELCARAFTHQDALASHRICCHISQMIGIQHHTPKEAR